MKELMESFIPSPKQQLKKELRNPVHMDVNQKVLSERISPSDTDASSKGVTITAINHKNPYKPSRRVHNPLNPLPTSFPTLPKEYTEENY